MHEAVPLALAWAAGLLLGAGFFGGLWWTVRRGSASAQPALWFLSSLLLRTGVALGGFCLVGRGDWQRLLACLFGFVVARSVALRLTRPPRERGNPPSGEAGHAPQSR
ncbi:MAG: ATP synthase subunit I [Pseudomonadota bacterium]|nr:ATP synthase subunit I [Pseudomonadota bacterium]